MITIYADEETGRWVPTEGQYAGRWVENDMSNMDDILALDAPPSPRAPIDVQSFEFAGLAVAECALLPGSRTIWRLDPSHPDTPQIAKMLASAGHRFIISSESSDLHQQCLAELWP
jgi:hypothetical protein